MAGSIRPRHAGDLLFHIRGESMDVCYEVGGRILAAMSGAVTVVDEVHGFRFFEMRDLLGFVDGTENPGGADAVAAALIGPESGEDPAFLGSSYVHVQRYIHDMVGWNALSTTEQELIIGRTKLDDIELDDAVKPANSHVALNTLHDEEGNELQIVRGNMPFGTLGNGESGTYFIAYAADPGVTEQMLTHMFIGDPPGNTDRILSSPPPAPAPCSSFPAPTSSTSPRRCPTPTPRPKRLRQKKFQTLHRTTTAPWRSAA